MSHSKKPPAGPPLGSTQASLAAQLGSSGAMSSFSSIAVGAPSPSLQHPQLHQSQSAAAKKSAPRRQVPQHTAAPADSHGSGIAASTGSSLSGPTSINIVSPQSPPSSLSVFPPPSPTASLRHSSATPSSFLYDSTSDAGNFFSEQDLLASDHAYIYSHQTTGAPLPLPSYFNSNTAASSTPGSPMRSLSSASANAFQAGASLFDDLGSSRADFKTPLECKVFNLRERMRDDFLDLLRQFNAEQRNKNRFGAATQNQPSNMNSHHLNQHRPSISSPAHEHAFAFNNGGNSNNSSSSSKSIESAMIKFIHEAHPVNFMWFAIELFVSELVSRCWSGVELLENRENSTTTSSAVTASSHAQMMKLELRLKQPATATILASGERKQSGAGLNSAAPSPSPRNQQGSSSSMQTPRKPQQNTPTSLRNQQSYHQQQNYRSALSPSYGNSSTTHGFGFNQDNGHVNPSSHFPPHLSFSFLHSASSPNSPATAIHAALQNLFPDIQEFFAAFVLCAGEHSYKLCVHLRQAIIMKMHQLTDIGAHVTNARPTNSQSSVNATSATSASHLSSQQWRFTQSNSVELVRTWHGRILKLKLLSKFLSLLQILPNFDLTRMAAAGGAPLGVGIDGLMQYTPSAAMTNVMHNTSAAINTLSFPSHVSGSNRATNLMSQAWIALAPTPALTSFSVDTFPLHLYLSYARVTESLSLFLPFICTFMRVLKFDLVNLQSEFYQRLLQELADIYFQLKKFIDTQRQAQLKLLSNTSKPATNNPHHQIQHHNQHGVGITRTFSSPVIFSSSTSSSPSFVPVTATVSNASIATTVTSSVTPTIGAGDASPSLAYTPIITPNVSPFPSPLPTAATTTNSTIASAYAKGGSMANAVHSPTAPSAKKVLYASYGSPTFETDVTPPLSPQLSAVSTQVEDRKADEGRISPFVFPPAATTSPSISKQSGLDDSIHSTLSSPRMVTSGRSLAVSSPSPVHMYNGLSSASGAAASMYSTRSQAFLAFELEELFEWLELDLHAYAEDFTRRKRREGWKSIHRDMVSAVNSNLNTPPHSTLSQAVHTPASATGPSPVHDRDLSSPAALAPNTTSVLSSTTSSVADPPPPRARKSLMSDFTHSTQSTVLHVRPLRGQAPPAPTRMSALPPAQPVTNHTNITSTPPSANVSTVVAQNQSSLNIASEASNAALFVRPTLTLDTIPHLVADNLFLSLLTSSQSRKSLDEVRQVMNGDYNSSGVGPTSVRKDSISGETEMDSSGGLNMPLLRRSASVATKRKIAPTTEATPALTSPVANSSQASTDSASSANSLALLRRDFFKRHHELSPLVRFIADNLEKHVLKDGHCINTIVAERFAEAMESFTHDSQGKIATLESGKDVTALKGMVDSLPASERTLLSSVTPSVSQRVFDAVSAYLNESMLQGLRSLASPTLHAVVIESAAQLTSQHSFATIKAAVNERVKQGIKLHSEKAFKKLKQSWLATCKTWIGETQAANEVQSFPGDTVPIDPTVKSTDDRAVNYVRLELATRVNNALRCFEVLGNEKQSELDEVALCKQGKSLLRVLLPLSICVSASQASTQAARQASFDCFRPVMLNDSTAPLSFFDKTCLALLPLGRKLSTDPLLLQQKLLGHLYEQCWQRVEAVFRVVAASNPLTPLLSIHETVSSDFPGEFRARMDRLVSFAPSDSSATNPTPIL